MMGPRLTSLVVATVASLLITATLTETCFAHARARPGRHRVAEAHTWAGSRTNTCDNVDSRSSGTARATCIRSSVFPPGFAYASAGATRYFGWAVTFKIGVASAGNRNTPFGMLQTEASYSDSVNVTMDNISANQMKLTLDGRAAWRSGTSGDVTVVAVAVYPDSNSADNGRGAVGGGSILLGPSGATFTGFLSPSDFTVTNNLPDSISVQANPSANYTFTGVDTANVTTDLDFHEGQSVPALPPAGVVAVLVLLGLAGSAFVLRRRWAPEGA